MDGTAAAVNSQLGLVTAAGNRAGVAGGAAMGAGLASGLKTAGVIGLALGAAGLLSESVNYFRDAVGLASDLAESGNAINVSFGDAAVGIAALGETAATRLGLSELAFNNLSVRFSSFARTIAGEGGDVVGVIDDLTTRGADFASVYNLEVSDALTLFQSGLAGETEPLRRYGIDLSAAAVEAFALANGIGEQGAALTEAEKVQARYLLLLDQTNQTAGDFANTSDGLANQQRIANAQFENAQAAIGEALLPAAIKFSDWMLEKGVPLVEKLADLFTNDLAPGIEAGTDAMLFMADYSTVALFDAVTDIFALFDDGIVTLDEAREAFARLPEPAQDAIVALSQVGLDMARVVYNAAAGSLNTAIGFVNGVLGALRPVAAFLNDAFGTDLRVPANLSPLALARYASASNAAFGVPVSEFSSGAGGRTAMASGAFVPAQSGGVAATIGEGRHDEVVLPLSDQVFRELGAAIGGGDRPIYMDGSIVGVLREVANREAELVLSSAVTGLGFDMRAGGVA